MKETIDDIELRQLLKKSVPEKAENQWFVKKVLNRLPEKTNYYGLAEKLLYVVGSVLCIVYWIYYIDTAHFTVITVRDLMMMGLMGVVTLVVMVQTVRHLFSWE